MRFKFPKFGENTPRSTHQESKIQNKSLNMVGEILKDKRDLLGISVNELASRTRISPAVIKAIESGVINQLPEKTYLNSILIILEKELCLPKDSLKTEVKSKTNPNKKINFNSFRPFNVQIFSSIQGTILYFLIILSSIYMINRQQEYLSRANTQTIMPLSIKPIEIKGQVIEKESLNPSKKKLLPQPGFKRLYRKDLFSFLSYFFIKAKGPGLLEIKLEKLSDITIKNGPNKSMKLNEIKGFIKLDLTKGSYVKIEPTPSNEDKVVWDGEEIKPLNKELGTYKLD